MNWYKKAQAQAGYGGKYNQKYFNQFVNDWDYFLNTHGIASAVKMMWSKYYGNKKPPEGFSSYFADKVLEYFPRGEQFQDDIIFIINMVPYEVKSIIYMQRPELDDIKALDEIRGKEGIIPGKYKEWVDKYRF